MYIHNNYFKTDLTDLNAIRTILCTHFYSNPLYLTELQNLIAGNLETLNIEYNPNEFSIYVRIKKTAMKKFYRFRHNPDFYYHITPQIFASFIGNHKYEIVSLLNNTGILNADQSVDNLLINKQRLSNLCHITCIADNIIIFKL